MSEDLRFPIGQYEKSKEITSTDRLKFIEEVSELPKKLREAVANLTDEQLDTPYRPEGWTVRQTVHHVADSHLNAYTRFKLALTEDIPTIRPYAEDRWANLADSQMPIDVFDENYRRFASALGKFIKRDVR